MHLRSDLLANVPGLAHGFGSLDEEVPLTLRPIWDRLHASWRQVHGTAVVQLETPPGERGSKPSNEPRPEPRLEGDAFWSSQAGLPVAVVTADCVPILLARRDGKCAGAIHAGWRGTIARITENFFEELAPHGEHPSQWVAAIGPAIGPCCYEVSEELAGRFASEFSDIAAQAVPRFRHLDLPAINVAELKRLGIGEVELLRACTRCSLSADGAPLYHSYRREGGGTRQYSVIIPGGSSL
jgi:polyphenol oxidase